MAQIELGDVPMEEPYDEAGAQADNGTRRAGPNAHLDLESPCAACSAVERRLPSVDLTGESKPLCQQHWNRLLAVWFSR